MLVVVHVRQTPQHAWPAGVRSGTRLSTGRARVLAFSSISQSVVSYAASLVLRVGQVCLFVESCQTTQTPSPHKGSDCS